MRIWAEELLRWVLIAFIGWCLGWSLVFAVDLLRGPGATVQGDGKNMKTEEELRAAQKYHGIMVSHCDEQGWYFNRAGRRCPLFTKGCMERIERRRARG